jgi:hypothetical protein
LNDSDLVLDRLSVTQNLELESVLKLIQGKKPGVQDIDSVKRALVQICREIAKKTLDEAIRFFVAQTRIKLGVDIRDFSDASLTTRMQGIIEALHRHKKPALAIGAPKPKRDKIAVFWDEVGAFETMPSPKNTKFFTDSFYPIPTQARYLSLNATDISQKNALDILWSIGVPRDQELSSSVSQGQFDAFATEKISQWPKEDEAMIEQEAALCAWIATIWPLSAAIALPNFWTRKLPTAKHNLSRKSMRRTLTSLSSALLILIP